MVDYQPIAELVKQIPADTWEILQEIQKRRPAMMLEELLGKSGAWEPSRLFSSKASPRLSPPRRANNAWPGFATRLAPDLPVVQCFMTDESDSPAEQGIRTAGRLWKGKSFSGPRQVDLWILLLAENQATPKLKGPRVCIPLAPAVSPVRT
jgi:hypothetical protein